MEGQKNGDNSYHSSYPEEMFNLENTHVDEAISNALNFLTRILSLRCISLSTTPSSSPSSSSWIRNPLISTPMNSLQPTISIRCGSSSSFFVLKQIIREKSS